MNYSYSVKCSNQWIIMTNINYSGYIMLTSRVDANNKLERIWNQVTVVCLRVLYHHLCENCWKPRKC